MTESRRKLVPFGYAAKSRESLDCLLYTMQNRSNHDHGFSRIREILREMRKYDTYEVGLTEKVGPNRKVSYTAFYDTDDEDCHYERVVASWGPDDRDSATYLEISVFSDGSADITLSFPENCIQPAGEIALDVLHENKYRRFDTIARVEFDSEGHVSDVTFIEYNEASTGWLVGDSRWASSIELHDMVNDTGFVEKETDDGVKLIIKA